MIFLLDASAVFAIMLGERGADVVSQAERGSQISVVNVGEVYSKLIDRGMSFEAVRADFEKLGLWVRTFREGHAWEVGRLRPLTRAYGLSFGDRACLAEARFGNLPVLTSDGDLARAGNALGINA